MHQIGATMSTDAVDNLESNTSQPSNSANDHFDHTMQFVDLSFDSESSTPLTDFDDSSVPTISTPDQYCQICPDCKSVLTPQYFLVKGHCQPSEIPPSGHTAPPQDWKCCNPLCAVQGEFSTRCNQCFPPKLLRWVQDRTNSEREHWILHCPECAQAGRSGKKKARKGAMCGRCIHCKVTRVRSGREMKGGRFGFL